MREEELAVVSVVIPIFNERRHLADLVRRVAELPLDKELVLVDDRSTDGTIDLLRSLEEIGPEAFGLPRSGAATHAFLNHFRVFYHTRNQGKGAALRTGFQQVGGDVVCIQDADLEYDPCDLVPLIELVRSGKADCAFGSRFLSKGRATGYLANRLANWFLTAMSNLATGLRLTDMETCYKVVRSDLIKSMSIEEDRFGFEPEVTAKLARLGARIVELPISYAARSHSDGKKIGIRDGIRAVYCILKYALVRAPRGVKAPA